MKIVVVGSGIVGTATGFGLKQGNDITFLDINPITVSALREQGYDARLTSDITGLTFDMVMVCVSTPSSPSGAVELGHIIKAMDTLETLLLQNNKWSLVVIRSTVPPTTTEHILAPLLERHGLRRGKDFGLCMNPEFLRAKSSVEDFAHPWVTVIGELDMRSGDMLEELYRPFGGKLFRVPIIEAELIKYVNNLRNALVISFTNEMWLLNRSMGSPADLNRVFDVVTQSAESAWNPRYGSIGGQPYGGTCLPKDTKGMFHFAMTQGHSMPLFGAVIHVNTLMEAMAEMGVVPQAQIEGHCWQPAPNIVCEKEEVLSQ